MPNITVTQEVVDTFREMGVDNIEAYLMNAADAYIVRKLDEEFKGKTKQEKKDLLKK